MLLFGMISTQEYEYLLERASYPCFHNVPSCPLDGEERLINRTESYEWTVMRECLILASITPQFRCQITMKLHLHPRVLLDSFVITESNSLTKIYGTESWLCPRESKIAVEEQAGNEQSYENADIYHLIIRNIRRARWRAAKLQKSRVFVNPLRVIRSASWAVNK